MVSGLKLALSSATVSRSDTQNRQGSSLNGNFFHWVQTSVRFVTTDPLVAKHQTAHASNPNNRRMETLRLGGLHCSVSETSCHAFYCALKSLYCWTKRQVWQWHNSCGFFKEFHQLHHHLRHHRGLTASRRTPNRWSPMHFCDVSGSSSSQLPTPFPLGKDFGWSSINASLGSAICSDVANASTAETFFVGSTFPSTFSVAFARIVTGFGENFLAVSDLQTVQFSIFAFHEFVPAGIMIAGFVVQISHHHWSRTTGYDC